MRKFKLFSYLLTAGMLFSNANMYAMEGQNQTTTTTTEPVSLATPIEHDYDICVTPREMDDRNQIHTEKPVSLAALIESDYDCVESDDDICVSHKEMINPFYGCVFNALFFPRSNAQKKRLASFVEELFGPYVDYSSIRLLKEVDLSTSSSSKGKLIVDIPFSTIGTAGKAYYNIKMQRSNEDENDIGFLIKRYIPEIQRDEQEYDPSAVELLINSTFDNMTEKCVKTASFDIASGKFKELSHGLGTGALEVYSLKANYYSSQDSKIDGREGIYFNGSELPDNGWMAFFDECTRIAEEMKNLKGCPAHTWAISSIHYDDYHYIIRGAIDRVLDSRLDSNKEIIKTLEKQDKTAKARFDNIERVRIATNMIKKGIPPELAAEYCEISTEKAEQIAKELKLSAQEEQESESKQDESGSLPISTK